MSITVNQEACIGCGACVAVCPRIFKLNAEGKSEVISQDNAECVPKAVDSCPVQAISVS